MSTTASNQRVNISKWIIVTGLITLAITIIRLIGELQHWNSALFNPSAGGGFAPIGIVWLVPILGIYFALKLNAAGMGPRSLGQVFLFVVIALAVIIAFFAIGSALKLPPGGPAFAVVGAVSAIIAILIMQRPWPALFRTLLAYGYAARIPVAILMIFAIQGNWGTHYDVAPNADFPAMPWLEKWFLIGAIPQLIGWIAFTVMIGSLFGAIAVVIANRLRTREHVPATP